VPTYEKNKNPWRELSSYILTPFLGENKKFMKYIARYKEFRDNKECND
jgi:hypothetical protein